MIPLDVPARRRPGPWRALAALAYAATLALLAWLHWAHGAKALVGDETLYWQRALGVAGLAPLGDKVWLWPPLQHWFLGALIRLFGPSPVAAQIVQQLMLLAAALLLRDLWRRLDGRPLAADLAAALFLLNPATLAYGFYLWPEPVHLLALLCALWVLPWPRLGTFVAGVELGVAILAKSLLAPFWPATLILFWRRVRPRLPWARAVLLVLGLGLVTAPMLIYGWRATGRPLIADSSGFNLVGGLTDRWRSDYIDDSVGMLFGEYLATPGTPQQRNAVMLDRAQAIVARQGFAETLSAQLGRQYFRLFSAKTLLVSQLPGPACAGYLGAYPGVPPAIANGLAAYAEAWHALTLAAAAFGLVLWRRWREPLAIWIALFLAYQLALFLGLHVKARFLLPMLPFLCGFGASFLASLRTPRAEGALPLPSTPWRWLGGGLLATLLLGLAFLGPWLDRSCA